MEAGDPIIVFLFCKIRNSSPDRTAEKQYNNKEGGEIRVMLFPFSKRGKFTDDENHFRGKDIKQEFCPLKTELFA